MTDQILIDSETWSSRELVEVIASRYFLLGNEGSFPNSWEVEGIDDSVSEQLSRLNGHLKSMGMVGSLEDKNPPVLTISLLPPGEEVLGRFQQIALWVVMFGFLAVVGSHWINEYGHGSNPLNFGSLGQSIFYFALPIALSMLMASFSRIYIARWFNIEVGHISPVVLPVPAWWSFGIVGAIGQRKPDMIPIPNRRALGYIEVVVPFVLFLSGSLLTVIGVMMTPSSPPSLNGAPTVFQTNFLTNALLDSWMGEELGIRLQWLHPIGIAGVGLSIIGWVLMMPIPGLPGDRILHSILGPSEMRDGRLQTSIFVAVLLAMVVIFATAQWTPWIFLAFIAAWQRFNPDNYSQPVILDEFVGLEENVRSRLVAIVGVILVAGLPGSIPSYEMESFDSGITTEDWISRLEITPGDDSEVVLSIEPDGVVPISGWIQYRIEGPGASDWSISDSCPQNEGSCRFENITQSNPSEISFNILAPNEAPLTHNLRIFVEIPGFELEHVIILTNSSQEGPINPFWKIIEEDPLLICSEIRLEEGGGAIVVEGPYWNLENSNLENSSNLSSGVQNVCVRGQEGAMQSSLTFDEQGRLMGPEMSLIRDNSTLGPWLLAIDGSMPQIGVENGSWSLPQGFAESGDVLFHADNGSPYCPSSDVSAKIDTDTNWSVEMSNFTSLRLTGNQMANGTLGLGSGGWLAVCYGDGTFDSYLISDSLDVFVSPGTLNRGLSGEIFSLTNRGTRELGISLETHGDSPLGGIWELEIPSLVGPGESVNLSILEKGEAPLERAVWITADDSGVTVHVSARCPSGGC
ncbi:MAG: hypothetical protein CMA12_02645 [Euryarchaeota archaeon]|nr:hypothetical protein [Euryarchaeota archaeon]OUW22749.1 MAG: hypothetical protein CBD33_01215 [Euryarchaeota archaeon TMED173]